VSSSSSYCSCGCHSLYSGRSGSSTMRTDSTANVEYLREKKMKLQRQLARLEEELEDIGSTSRSTSRSKNA